METISAVRRNGAKPRQAAGHRRNKTAQTVFSPAGIIADGFLKHRFLPLYEPSGKTPPMKAAGEFFTSLRRLSKTYQLQEMNVIDKPYPYNVLLAHWDMCGKLNRSNQEVELDILQDENGKVLVATKQTYNTGTTLYYIPVIPLYRLLQDKRNRQAGDLLLSVFSYLHKFGGVPYYRDEGSGTYCYYEMMEEWVRDDLAGEGIEEQNRQLSCLNAALFYGDEVFRMLRNKIHLDELAQRIERFKPADTFEYDCLAVAKAAYDLWLHFQKCNIFQHTCSPETDEEEDGIVRAEQYISFVSDTKGWLFNTLSDMVSSEFNECAKMEEPTVGQVFDEYAPPLPVNLNFERRIFDLISDLCTLLNDLP